VHENPALDAGAAIPGRQWPENQDFDLLRHLAERHHLRLMSLLRSEKEEAAAQALRHRCVTEDAVHMRRSRVRNIVYLSEALIRRQPFLIHRDDSAALRARIDKLLDGYRFDVVRADRLSMGPLAVGLPIPLRVLDEHNRCGPSSGGPRPASAGRQASPGRD
jgi:hypothetical protein